MTTEAIKAFGTQLQRGTTVAAHLATGVVNDNNSILWTAATEGVGGNSIRITLSNPGGNGTLSVAVATLDITVTLARTGGSITSTAAQVIAAIQASNDADALVSVENNSTSTGAGIVAAVSQTNLANGAADETYDTIAELNDITGPSMRRNTADCTSHSSEDAYREFILADLDMGEVSFSVNFLMVNDTHDHVLGLLHDMKHGTLRNFRLIFPDDDVTTWDFTGFVTGVTTKEPIEGFLGGDITLKLTGSPTLA